MYHRVRPIKNNNNPNLKGLEFDDFKNQINYFCNNFNIISKNDFIEILNSKKIPEKPSFLLTFDDGYIDHYEYVFPYLKNKKISGCFYPTRKAIENKIVMDFNKIHFILEKEQNRKKILKEIDLILVQQNKKGLKEMNLESINLKSRYDDKDTMLIKQLLQIFLPLKDRENIINIIFKKILNEDLESFSKKIYMNMGQVKEMHSEKMDFGLHGDYHYYWKCLDEKNQDKEIKNSIDFFKNLGFDTQNISLSYPYGSYNEITLNLISKYNVSFGLTVEVNKVNSQNIINKFELPRYDANDFKN